MPVRIKIKKIARNNHERDYQAEQVDPQTAKQVGEQAIKSAVEAEAALRLDDLLANIDDLLEHDYQVPVAPPEQNDSL